MVMVERKKSIKQLRAIKDYLSGIKTGDKIKKAHLARNSSTQVESTRRGFFF